MRRILLIEPSYRNKYPPLGLMKISAYHKMLGDEVVFCKGTNLSLRQEKWDRIYITSLFTFYWNTTIKTIKYYLKSVDNTKHIFVGGPMATIMAEEILAQKGLEEITILRGLLNKPNMLDENEHIVDNMVPDYSIIDTTKDARLLYEHPEKMELLSRVAVKPLRIAFDDADDEFVKIYTRCMWLAAENNIKDVSNYILFNFEDEPNDLYKRLEINVLLNTQFENAGYRTMWLKGGNFNEEDYHQHQQHPRRLCRPVLRCVATGRRVQECIHRADETRRNRRN